MDGPLVSLVVSAAAGGRVEELLERHRALAGAHPQLRFELVLVDDGSPDAAGDRMLAAARPEQIVRVASLARAAGAYAALCAGLAVSRGDGVLVLDVARPGSTTTVDRVLAAWRDGHDVVWAAPPPASGRLRAALRRVPGLPMVPGERRPQLLVDRAVLDAVAAAPHRDVVAAIGRAGERQTTLIVEPSAPTRSIGRRVLHGLGWLVGVYTAPFLLLLLIGLAVAAVGLVAGLGLVVLALVTRAKDWALVVATVLFVGGLNVAALGGFGEYLWRAGGDRERSAYVLAGVRDSGPSLRQT